jgi:hypothetical protein
MRTRYSTLIPERHPVRQPLRGSGPHRGLAERRQQPPTPLGPRLAHPSRVRRALGPPTAATARIAGGSSSGVPSHPRCPAHPRQPPRTASKTARPAAHPPTTPRIRTINADPQRNKARLAYLRPRTRCVHLETLWKSRLGEEVEQGPARSPSHRAGEGVAATVAALILMVAIVAGVGAARADRVLGRRDRALSVEDRRSGRPMSAVPERAAAYRAPARWPSCSIDGRYW